MRIRIDSDVYLNQRFNVHGRPPKNVNPGQRGPYGWKMLSSECIMIEEPEMYSNPQKLVDEDVGELRRDAGQWLKRLRENRGLSQRDLAEKVGVEYYTFISQVESGRGRIPPDRYRVWAKALGVPARGFVLHLMRYYDPVTYRILFESVS
jgi:Helix-turn-helix domain